MMFFLHSLKPFQKAMLIHALAVRVADLDANSIKSGWRPGYEFGGWLRADMLHSWRLLDKAMTSNSQSCQYRISFKGIEMLHPVGSIIKFRGSEIPATIKVIHATKPRFGVEYVADGKTVTQWHGINEFILNTTQEPEAHHVGQ